MTDINLFERRFADALRGYADEVDATVDAAAVAGRVIDARRGSRAPALQWGAAALPRLAWLLLAAGLLLALVVGSLVAGSRLQHQAVVTEPPTALQPTGIEVLTPESTGYDRVVVDGLGDHWAIGPGHLTRFDPESGARMTWTVSDDVAFGDVRPVAPAAAGGVWLQVGDVIRRFDGAAFRESIPAPDDGPFPFTDSYAPAFDAALDGTLWSLSLKHWDGSAWVEPPAGGPAWKELQPGFGRSASAGQQSRRVLARDGAWVVSGATVAHLADGRWTIYGPAETGFGAGFRYIAEADDGSIWLLDEEHRVVRFDGRTWTNVEGPGFTVDQLVAGSDGSVWGVGEAPVTAVARYSGGQWTTFGAVERLAGTGGTFSATPAGLFLGNSAGVQCLAGDRWVPVWEVQRGPVEPGQIVPISRDEAWVVDGASLWHYLDDGWETPVALTDLVTPGSAIGGVVLGPDDAIWVTGDSGVAVLSNGTWRTVAGAGLNVLAVDANGTAWASDGSDGGVAALSSDSGVPIRRFRCPTAAANVAIASDGSAYVGGSWQTLGGGSATPGLSRIVGTTCSGVDPLGDGKAHDVWSVAAGPEGQVAVAVSVAAAGSRSAADLLPEVAIVLFDGTAWRVIDPTSTDSTGSCGSGPAAAAPGATVFFDVQGRLWQQSGLSDRPPERFDRTRWILGDCPPQPEEGRAWNSRWVAPDGGTWYGGPSGVERIQTEQ